VNKIPTATSTHKNANE